MEGDINKDNRKTEMSAKYGTGGKKIDITMKYGGLKIK
jgi:hypothetical protein